MVCHAMPCHALFCFDNQWSMSSSWASALQSFHSRAGKAYLFSAVVNVVSAAKEQRSMTTGLHTVADLYCNGCMHLVGWTYVRPFSPDKVY